NSFTADVTEEGFNELIKNEKVSEIYLDITGHVSLDDSVPLINADDVWSLNYTGDGATICIIDSGVNAAHPDLNGKIQDEYCYCSYTDLGNGGCCPDTTDEDDDAEDDLGHGTHVSGIIASQDSTYKGVAYDADIYVVKVTNSNGDFYFSDLGDAIDMCRLWDVNIISISLSDGGNHPGSSSCPTSIDTKINNAYNEGISIIAASGNNGYTTGISYPACSPHVISTGATTKSDNMASFTNRGSNLNLLAPGQSIVSLRWNSGETMTGCSGLGDNFMVCSGTSMAAPHVSGAVALLLEKDPSLTPDEIREILEDTGTSISGYPRINVLAAVNSIGAEGEEGQISDCEESRYD
ncbi:S8 family serine peptidase, partial [Candidatus Woesearchaeota archaeon]|nr:S8 family serine peptidase [Candidatus Woesearchaeota archaeon]